MRQDGAHVPVNFWNGRKQLQFKLEGEDRVTLVVKLKDGAVGERGFECWLATGDARFLDHIDDTYIVEPAAFSIGDCSRSYSRQLFIGAEDAWLQA